LSVAITVAVAALAWRLVEDPIRHGALGRLWRQARSLTADVGRARRILIAAGVPVALLCLPALALAGVLSHHHPAAPPPPAASAVARESVPNNGAAAGPVTR